MKILWITWQDHRRSRELAKALNTDYVVFESKRSLPCRYLILSYKTLSYLINNHYEVVICQNPSIILAALLAFFKVLLGYKLIVDRHTNFKFTTEKSKNIKWMFFHSISNYSLRHADLTIVTNSPLANLVEARGGKAYVLPDKLPDLAHPKHTLKLKGEFNCLFICTFCDDEPVEEVLNAYKELPTSYCLYVTGNYQKFKNLNDYSSTENIIFLGFVPEEEYIAYLFSCDATIVLTKNQMTLNCGSYESVIAGKPQIVADSPVIRDYFSKGCIYVSDFSAQGIRVAVHCLKDHLSALKTDVIQIQNELLAHWEADFKKLQVLIELA